MRRSELKSSLAPFLSDAKNSKARELLLTSKVIHDLMVSGAARNYDVLVYSPTVDSDGFDLILDDRDVFLPLQLKSVLAGGKASHWAIHRKLLRPQPHETECFGFEASACGEGRAGGVLLIEVTPTMCTVEVSYHYTDIRVLTALWLDTLPMTKSSKHRLLRLRQELSEMPGGKVDVPKSAFLKARSPEHLLALMGLHSRYTNSWPHLLYDLARHHYEKRGLSARLRTIQSEIKDDLLNLIVRGKKANSRPRLDAAHATLLSRRN